MDEVRKLYKAGGVQENADASAVQALGRDTGGQYGELTAASVQRLLQAMGVRDDSVFMDIGSGAMKPCIVAALLCNARRSLGVELSPERHFAGLKAQLRMLQGASPAMQDRLLRVESMVGDAMRAPSFAPATHVYSFDLSWTEDLMRAIVHTLARSTTVRVFATFRVPPHLMQELGVAEHLVHVQTVPRMRFYGSGECKSAYVYAVTPRVSDAAQAAALFAPRAAPALEQRLAELRAAVDAVARAPRARRAAVDAPPLHRAMHMTAASNVIEVGPGRLALAVAPHVRQCLVLSSSLRDLRALHAEIARAGVRNVATRFVSGAPSFDPASHVLLTRPRDADLEAFARSRSSWLGVAGAGVDQPALQDRGACGGLRLWERAAAPAAPYARRFEEPAFADVGAASGAVIGHLLSLRRMVQMHNRRARDPAVMRAVMADGAARARFLERQEALVQLLERRADHMLRWMEYVIV